MAAYADRIELLRDVFVWAYERSCQQYVAVKQNLVPPDIFRLRYRQALSEVVAAIVKHDEALKFDCMRPSIALSNQHQATRFAGSDATKFDKSVHHLVR